MEGLRGRGSWLLALEKRGLAEGSGVGVVVTGRVMEKDFSSLMQEVSQICQVACALREKVVPGVSEGGGVISMRKMGAPG